MTGATLNRLGMAVMIIGGLGVYAALFAYATGGAVLTGTGWVEPETYEAVVAPWLWTLVGLGGLSFPAGLAITKAADGLRRREREQVGR